MKRAKKRKQALTKPELEEIYLDRLAALVLQGVRRYLETKQHRSPPTKDWVKSYIKQTFSPTPSWRGLLDKDIVNFLVTQILIKLLA